MENRSRIDPTRKTAGAIYRDAQINGERGVIIGDVNYEIKKDLVTEINECVQHGTKALEGKPFYIAFYEKYDLMLKRGLVRIPKITTYRPYPEQDTMVFHVYPTSNEIYFCWELPHRSQMINILNSPDLFDHQRVAMIKHWENLRLEYYGFMRDDDGNWTENKLFRGDTLISKPSSDIEISMSSPKKSLILVS